MPLMLSPRTHHDHVASRTTTSTRFVVLSHFFFWSSTLTASGFQILPLATTRSTRRNHPDVIFPSSNTLLLSSPSSKNNILDVEFEKSPDDYDGKPKGKRTQKKKQKRKSKSKGFAKTNDDDNKSLFELSLETGDPQWKDARIPFVDTFQNTAIDGTLAFLIDSDDGVQYGIAVPCDAAVAITVEDRFDGSITNLYPDPQSSSEEDEHDELMEIMAAQLVEHVGADLALKKTPRVLTVTGDLDKYTQNWQDELLPKPHTPEELLQDDDESIEWFHEFMRKELGQEEYDKTMAEPATAESIGDELMELFDIPGFGERSNDVEGMEEAFIKSLEREDDPRKALLDAMGGDPLDHEGAALKLISYIFKNGKSYSLVKLLKPYTLVGRLMANASEEDKGKIQFELLTREEEKLIVPMLEEACRKDLEDANNNNNGLLSP